MSDACSLFPSFGDPRPSFLIPSHCLIFRWIMTSAKSKNKTVVISFLHAFIHCLFFLCLTQMHGSSPDVGWEPRTDVCRLLPYTLVLDIKKVYTVKTISFNGMTLNWESRGRVVSHHFTSMGFVSFLFLTSRVAECTWDVRVISGAPCGHYWVYKASIGRSESCLKPETMLWAWNPSSNTWI